MSRGVPSFTTVAALVAIALPATAAADPPSPVPLGSAGVSAAGGLDVAQPFAGQRAPDAKRRANQWYDEYEAAGPTEVCNSDPVMFDELGNAWTGWFGNIGVNPHVNDVYYVRVGWDIAGNPCTGGAGVHAELVLPAHTQLAISQTNKVRCWYQSPSQSSMHEFGAPDCPQNPQNGFYGGYAFDPPGNQGPWPSATGSFTEIWVPVKTSQPLSGLESGNGQPCYTCVYAGVWMIDGYNSPWVWPRQGVNVVGSGTPTQPVVTYPGPSVKDVSYRTDLMLVQAELDANIFNSGPGGEARYQFGTHAGNYDTDSGPISIQPSGDFLVFNDFGFPPGKDVHWRFCYTPTGGGQTCGSDQLYKPPPETGIQDITVKKQTAKVSFDSPPVTNMTAHYQCKLDSKPYKPCTNPTKYRRLKHGNHTVSARAVDQDGHKDSTPAKQAFKV